jgi:replicative DNA helicase
VSQPIRAAKSTRVHKVNSSGDDARRLSPEQVLGEVRAMPEDLASEGAVLGSMLLDPVCISEVVEKLKVEDFYRQEHRIIFEGIVALYEKNRGVGVDAVLLRNELTNYKKLDEAGGVEYLAKLMNTVPSATSAMYYANIVKDKALLREMVAVAGEILDDAFNGLGETAEKLDRAEQRIFEVTNKRITSNAISLKDLLIPVYNLIDKRKDQQVTGVATGYTQLDNLTCGLQNGEMIVIAGRPSMGKTSFALNIAEYISTVDKIPVAIFSLEMSKQQLTERFMSSISQLDAQRMKKGMLNEDELIQLKDSCGPLFEAPIYIDDSGALTPLELRAKARRLKKQHDIKCIMIDYLQLMSGGNYRIESRQQEVTLISRHLKALAKELDIPVVVLSQLNRSPEGREDHRPRMSDLRESGSIEQDADVVMLLHREGYYQAKQLGSAREDELGSGAKGSSIREGGDQNKPLTNTAELIIAKQRNGPTDTVELTFREKIMRFENKSYAEEPF